MAIFNPDLPKSNPDDYTRRSEGFRPAPEQAAPPNVDGDLLRTSAVARAKSKSMSPYIDAAANLFGPLVKVGEIAMENYIQNDIQSEVDKARTDYGNDAAITVAAGNNAFSSNPPTPEAITQAEKNLEGLTAANAAGRLPESHYWARLETMVRQMKMRFPGHKDEIDQMVGRIAGATPANALRRALQDERDRVTGQLDAEHVASVRLQQELAQGGILDEAVPGASERIARGETLSLEEMTVGQNRVQARETQRKRELDDLNLDAKRGEVDKTKTEAVAARQVSEMADVLINTSMNQTAPNGKTFRENLREAQDALLAGGAPDSKQAAIVAGQFTVLRENTLGSMRTYLRRNFSGLEGGARLDAEAQKRILDPIEAQFKDMETAILTGDASMLKISDTLAKAMVDKAAYQQLDRSAVLTSVSALRRNIGPELANVYLNALPKDFADFTTVLTTQAVTDAATDRGSVAQSFDKMKDSKVTDPRAYTSTVQTLAKMLADPSVPEATKTSIVNRTFSPENWKVIGRLQPQDQVTTYGMLTSEEVRNVMEARKGEDPQGWSNYVEWTKQSFMSLLRQRGDDIATSLGSDFQLQMDSGTGELKITSDPSATAPKPTAKGNVRHNQFLNRDLQLKVAQFNTAMAGLAPIVIANGEDPIQTFKMILANSGIPAQAFTQALDKIQAEQEAEQKASTQNP